MTACVLLIAGPAEASPIDQWTAEISEASLRFGVPEQWIRRVMQVESGGNAIVHGRSVVSSAGAIGLMQLMPATWSEMRALLGLGSDAREPRDNILAGTFYLRLLYNRFGYPGLFAAYNAGPERYSAHLATGQQLPRETRAYVAAVAGANYPQEMAAEPLEREPRRPRAGTGIGAVSGSGLKPRSAGLFVPLNETAAP